MSDYQPCPCCGAPTEVVEIAPRRIVPNVNDRGEVDGLIMLHATRRNRFKREAIEAEIVAWLREIAAWNNKHDDGLSGLDKMAQGQLEAAEAIELGEYRSKSDEGRPVST
jgi:hypothetical protein